MKHLLMKISINENNLLRLYFLLILEGVFWKAISFFFQIMSASENFHVNQREFEFLVILLWVYQVFLFLAFIIIIIFYGQLLWIEWLFIYRYISVFQLRRVCFLTFL